ncbi:MAG: hypothetical protein A2W85_13615 [Bacteroidetes bacterium GWF2_41_31]|nr:MAG: hypothetical protein A2W85_13615 [Bacteroidetes bacterium GWF2_41_31]
MKMNFSVLYQAFPSELRTEITSMINTVDFKSELDSSGSFQVYLNKEKLAIPYRVYYESQRLFDSKGLNKIQNDILNCILTRHHNGFIREKCLMNILKSDNEWTSPFIFQLIGEYVLELDQLILNNLNENNINKLTKVIIENPEFAETTENRVISYWNCYYRNEYPKKEDFVGFKIFRLLKDELK